MNSLDPFEVPNKQLTSDAQVDTNTPPSLFLWEFFQLRPLNMTMPNDICTIFFTVITGA